MVFFNYIKKSFGLYFNNSGSYHYIDKKVTWQEAFIYTILFSFIFSVIAILIRSFFEGGVKFFIQNVIAVLLESSIYLPIFLLIFYGIYHFLFKLFEGKANFFDTLKFGVSSSLFSTFILIIFMSVPTTILNEGTKKILEIVITLIALVILMWMFAVLIRIYSYLHDLSFVKTAMILISPLIITFVLAVVIFIFLIIFGYATF